MPGGRSAADGARRTALRVDERAVLIMLPPFPAFRIGAAETVRVTVPAAATALGVSDLVANPSLVLRPKQARLSGSLVGGVDESTLRTAAHELLIPPLPRYSIARPETIDVSVPASAVASRQTLWSVNGGFVITPSPGSIVLSGPPVADGTEVYLRDSIRNRTLGLTLLDDEWDVARGDSARPRRFLEPAELQEYEPELVGAEDTELQGAGYPDGLHPHGYAAIAQALVDGLSSGQSEPGGFNAALAGNRTQFQLKLFNASFLQMEIPVTPYYDITRPETISLTVPAAAVISRAPPSLEAPWIVLPSVGTPTLHESLDGPLLSEVKEAVLQANGTAFTIQIASDGFVEAVGQDDLASVQLIDAIVSRQDEAFGWNAVIRKLLTYEAIERADEGSSVRITVPSFPQYDVLAPETIGIVLPSTVLWSGQSVELEQTFEVRATSGVAETGGTLALRGDSVVEQTCCAREDYLKNGGDGELVPTLVITLRRDHWEDGLEQPGSEALSALFGSIRGGARQLYGWDRVVQPALGAHLVSVGSVEIERDTLTIALPALPSFHIFEPEEITVTVRAAATWTERVGEGDSRRRALSHRCPAGTVDPGPRSVEADLGGIQRGWPGPCSVKADLCGIQRGWPGPCSIKADLGGIQRGWPGPRSVEADIGGIQRGCGCPGPLEADLAQVRDVGPRVA